MTVLGPRTPVVQSLLERSPRPLPRDVSRPELSVALAYRFRIAVDHQLIYLVPVRRCTGRIRSVIQHVNHSDKRSPRLDDGN